MLPLRDWVFALLENTGANRKSPSCPIPTIGSLTVHIIIRVIESGRVHFFSVLFIICRSLCGFGLLQHILCIFFMHSIQNAGRTDRIGHKKHIWALIIELLVTFL